MLVWYFLIFFVLVATRRATTYATSTRIVSFNSGLTPKVAHYDERRLEIAPALVELNADIVCLQEVMFLCYVKICIYKTMLTQATSMPNWMYEIDFSLPPSLSLSLSHSLSLSLSLFVLSNSIYLRHVLVMQNMHFVLMLYVPVTKVVYTPL